MRSRSHWIVVAALALPLIFSDVCLTISGNEGLSRADTGVGVVQQGGSALGLFSAATGAGKAEPGKPGNDSGTDANSGSGQPQKGETTGAEAPDEVQALKTRIIELQNNGKLGFRKIVVCRSVEGFGAYSPLEPGEQVPKIIVYCEPSNVSTMVSADRYIVDCSVDAFLMDSGNKLVLGRQNVVKINRVSRSPIIDLFFKIEINAQKLGNRNIIVKVVLHDKIKNQSVSSFHKINLEGGAKKTLDKI